MSAFDIVQHATAQSAGSANTAGDQIAVTLGTIPTVSNLLILVVSAAGAAAGEALPDWPVYTTPFSGQLAVTGYNDGNVNCYLRKAETGESATVNVVVGGDGQAVAAALLEVVPPNNVQSGNLTSALAGVHVAVATVTADPQVLLPNSTSDLAIAVTGLKGFTAPVTSFATDHSFTQLDTVQTVPGTAAVGLNLATLLYGVGGATPVAPPAPPPDPPPPPDPVDPGATTYWFRDFAVQNSGMVLAGSLVGAGMGLSYYEMVPYSSTKAALVPTTVGTTTNPFTLMTAAGNDAAHVASGLVLSDFSLIGTHQGMLYNGLRIGYSTNAQISNLFIKGIPGNSSANPGETFSINLWHANGARITRVGVDGTDDTAAKVAASAFGLNNLINVILTDCYAHGTRYGSGATNYKCGDITYVRFNSDGNHRPFNFERCFGSLTLTGCIMTNNVARPHVTVNTDSGSAIVHITDPVVSFWPLRVGVSSGLYMGHTQTQRVSDVHLTVAGVDQTHNPAFLLCGNVW